MKIYEKFRRVKYSLKKFVDIGMVNLKKYINNVRLETIKYRNVQYFLNKLEQKLNTKFEIDISKIRNILYGCHPNDVESQKIEIQEYYDFILYCKRESSSGNKKIDGFIKNHVFCQRISISQHRAMSNYSFNLDKKLPLLYGYHKTIPETFTVSKTRFSLYEKTLNEYKKLEKPYIFYKEHKAALILNYCVLPSDDDERAREIFFKYLSYEQGNNNCFFFRLRRIKLFLLRCLMKEVVSVIN